MILLAIDTETPDPGSGMFMKNRTIVSGLFGAQARAVAAFLAVLWMEPAPVQAQGTVWNGPYIFFTEPSGDNGTLPVDQDRITPDVWLTRNANGPPMSGGLFNIALEGGFTPFDSPTNTEWAYGTLAQYTNLTYQNWEAWTGQNPPSMVDQPAVLHIISDNIYIGIEFTSWPQRGVGGFTYQRTTQAVPEASSGLLMLAGLAIFGVRWRRISSDARRHNRKSDSNGTESLSPEFLL